MSLNIKAIDPLYLHILYYYAFGEKCLIIDFNFNQALNSISIFHKYNIVLIIISLISGNLNINTLNIKHKTILY